MGSFRAGLGKGLLEPCYLFPKAPVYGVPLNQVNTSGWGRCPAIIDGPADTFTLDGLTKPCEVLVALAVVDGNLVGNYEVRFRWYRKAELYPINEYVHRVAMPFSSWVWAYSYIGWVDWEIDGPGDYRVEIEVTGAEQFRQVLPFKVTQALPPPIPVPLIGEGLDLVVSALQGASALCYQAYLIAYGWIWPFSLLSEPLYTLSSRFQGASQGVGEFKTWVAWATQGIANLVSPANLKPIILSWFPGLEQLVSWFFTWWENVRGVVENWWFGVAPTVQGWIAAATAGLGDLRAAWDQFWQVTLPGLVSWDNLASWWAGVLTNVQRLIDSAFLARDGLWSGWQEMRDNVVTFFQDPLGYLERKFVDWFLGDSR